MKFLITLFALVSVSAMAAEKASLTFPVLDGNTSQLLSRHNAALRKAGLKTFPKTITVRSRKDADKKLKELEAIANAAHDKLGLDIELMMYSTPSQYMTKNDSTRLCYTGNPYKAIDLVTDLTDSLLSDQFVLWAWKYRSDARNVSGSDDESDRDYPAVWHKWRGNTSAILLISSSGDGGDDRDAAVVVECEKN